MDKVKNKKRMYLLIGLLVLIVCIVGGTYSYFTAVATDNSTIYGEIASAGFEMNVEKVTHVDEVKGGIIPMSNNMVEASLTSNKGVCVDDNGNAVCQIYKVTVNNVGALSLMVDGYVSLYGGSGIPGDYTGTLNNTTMRWAQVFCNKEEDGVVSECTTSGKATTRSNEEILLNNIGGESVKENYYNTDNLLTNREDILTSGTINGKPYDMIGKNYIRVSDHSVDNENYKQDEDITSALVYNQFLSPRDGNTSNNTGTSSSTFTDSQVYYIALWLGENGKNQTAGATDASIISEKFFGGVVTFTSAGGSVSSSFANTDDNGNTLSSYIKSLYNDGSSLTKVHIGGDEANPEVSLNDTQSLMLDNNGEYRYYGSNPNNYVTFNNELWRIISVSNVKKNEEDTEGETRIKIIRNQPIGNYSWDSSDSSVNSGYGVNDWTKADLNTLLNDYYYNGLDNQTCYNGQNNASTTCNFSSIGLNKEAKRMIDGALWNLGGHNSYSVFTHDMYSYEKETTTYNCSTDDGACPRATAWTGKVGLMYPSDYGYATDLRSCIQNFYYYDNINSCKNKNWLFKFVTQWTLTPDSANAYDVWSVTGSGNVVNALSSYYSNVSVRPTLYLKSNVKIVQNDRNGSRDKPYGLSI